MPARETKFLFGKWASDENMWQEQLLVRLVHSLFNINHCIYGRGHLGEGRSHLGKGLVHIGEGCGPA